ncbi:MAG: cytochrome P450 [Rhodospirillales bacterium]|nr:cytochrome P450 [Rhodospirillales bacterium]
MRITEEIVILALDQESGEFRRGLSEHHRKLVIAGAVLMDLALEDRIDTDLERLLLLDAATLNDDLLDPSLADIAGETETHDTAWWIAHIAKRSDEILERTVGRLTDRGVLSRDENGAIMLSRLVARLRRYPVIDGEARTDIETRIFRTLFGDDIPDHRDVLIVALAAASNVFQTMLSSEELTAARERIDLVSRLDLIGRVVGDSIRAVAPPPPPSRKVRAYEEIPEVRGLPVAGNVFQMAGDLNEFFTDCYKKYGPIFRVRAFGRRFIVLAGPEANEFVTKISATHLRSHETFSDFSAAVGAQRFITGMDGPDHLRMRKLLARGFSPKPLEARLDTVYDATRNIVLDWPKDRPLGIRSAMQGIVTEQIGLASTGVSATDHVDDLSVYLDTLIAVHVGRYWPGFKKRLPRFRRAERRLKVFVDEILAVHRAEEREGRKPDLIDDLLEMHRSDPQFMPETDLFPNVIAPFVVGIDTSANICAFMLYSLLRRPDLLERMRNEVDEMFDRGPPTPEGLRNLDVTHRIGMETLRMYPIAPSLLRVVCNSFEFEGYRVPAGSKVLVGLSVGHHLPEYFPNPDEFDIERWSRRTPQHRASRAAYAPMGLGRHRCLGSKMSEVQIALTMATIVRETEIVPDKPERRSRIRYLPVRHLDDSAEFRVLRHRGNAAPVSTVDLDATGGA